MDGNTIIKWTVPKSIAVLSESAPSSRPSTPSLKHRPRRFDVVTALNLTIPIFALTVSRISF